MKELTAVLAELNAHVERRAYVEAISLADAFIAQNGENAAILRARSGACASAGRLTEARVDAQKCLALQPGNLNYIIHAASLAIETGAPFEAVELLQPWAAEGTSGEGAIERVLSAALAACGEHRRALHFADIAMQRQPSREEYRVHRDGLLNHAANQIRISRNSAHGGGDLGGAQPSVLRIQCRVIYALVLREIAGQYERSRLGYLWAIIEPIVHLMVLGLFFSLLNHTIAPLGHNLYLFYLTGLLPFFMVIHTGSKVMQGLSANKSLLLLPPIKILDILVARGVLSLLTELFVAVLILGIFNLLGIVAIPDDCLLTLSGLLLAWFFGVSLGILMAMLSELFESWEMIWSQITRVMYFCSGIFYVAEKMPPKIRAVLIWNPVLQCIELLRSGFYSGFSPPWVRPDYVMLAALIMLAAGCALSRVCARHIGVEE
jgi:capsular polysaccharide transport system permease protein